MDLHPSFGLSDLDSHTAKPWDDTVKSLLEHGILIRMNCRSEILSSGFSKPTLYGILNFHGLNLTQIG